MTLQMTPTWSSQPPTTVYYIQINKDIHQIWTNEDNRETTIHGGELNSSSVDKKTVVTGMYKIN